MVDGYAFSWENQVTGVAVVGVGVVSPAGCELAALWDAALAARSSASTVEFVDLPGWTTMVCRADGFAPESRLERHEVRRLDRQQQMAIVAADDALAGLNLPEPSRCAVVVGVGWGASHTLEQHFKSLLQEGQRAVTPLAIPMVMSNSAAAHLSLRYGFTGPAHTISTACASGASAIGEAMWLLRSGRADFVLAGGVDAPIAFGLMSFFARMEAMSTMVESPAVASRPFDRDRDGFVLGEGAGFVVLVREADIDRRSRFGTILGYGATSDAFHLVAPPENGEGAVACMEAALKDAGIGPRDVGHINAHGTSTTRNDLAEAKAISRVFGASTPPVTALKGAIGHLLGGAGAVEAIEAMLTARHLMVPPVAGLANVDPEVAVDVVCGPPRPITNPVGLSNSFGFGGHNACLVVSD
jgi:3-oxoacyl-[acyl-carrier-protein] synthase II